MDKRNPIKFKVWGRDENEGIEVGYADENGDFKNPHRPNYAMRGETKVIKL